MTAYLFVDPLGDDLVALLRLVAPQRPDPEGDLERKIEKCDLELPF